MPTLVLQNQSPFQALYGSQPVISHFKVFGCSCYLLLRPYNSTKLQARTTKCVFLGYASKYKGYICYEVQKGKFFVSRHVVFDETEFPYLGLLKLTTQSSHSSILPSLSNFSSSSHCITPVPNANNILVVPTSHYPSYSHTSNVPTPASFNLPSPDVPAHVILASDVSLSPLPSPTSQSITATVHDPIQLSVVPEFSPDHLQVVLPITPLNMHSMQTRGKSGIIKHKAFLSTLETSGEVDMSLIEPATYKTTMRSTVWMNAIKDEIEALHSQGTWYLVPLLSQKNLVGCKWVFKIKKNVDGSVARHNARLVAKGFSQEEGLDYGEIFNPVVKHTTVRLVLALAAQFH